MANNKVSTDVREVVRLSVKLDKRADVVGVMNALERVGIYLTAYVKGQKLSGNPINRRTGNLSRHIAYEVSAVGGRLQVKVGVVRGAQDVPYARYLEEGTRPHIIEPKTKKALAFQMGGEYLAFRRVHHPGNRAFRFLRGSLDENRERVRDMIVKGALKK